MDKELKELVEQVESCFPEKTTSDQVINVATVLLVKALLGMTSKMTSAQTQREAVELCDHVCRNIMANMESQLIAKHAKTFLTHMTNESHSN